ncbi:MAG: exported protein [marine bacterium B5-7]|nr:MAG: exported protein [marine bacterium B5-7]
MNSFIPTHYSKMAKSVGAATALLLASAIYTSASAETWDMPTPYPDATFHTVNINQFAEDVAKATNGALEIKVHSAGSLFKHPEISKAVRGGQVPIGEFFLSLLNNENPAFGVDSIPFLVTSYDDAARLWSAQKPVIEKLLDAQNMIPLFSVPWPPQGLYTKKPIASVDDLKGLKFRTYNATLEQFANLAGAAPTQVEVPDIPQAFSTGRVEAMITSPSTGANSKSWDYLSHYTDIQAWIPKNIVVVNKRAFRKLDDATRDAVLAAAAQAEKRGWQMSREETDTKTAILRDNGITVVEPSAELLDGLRAIGATILEQWKKDAGDTGAAILKAYQQ